MNLLRTVLTAVFLLLLLPACARQQQATTTPPTPTEVLLTPSIEPTDTAVAIAQPRPTITPEPTPIVPVIEAAPQALTEDGRLVVNSVIATEPGWLLLLSDKEGEAGDILGYAPIVPGTNDEIIVEIEPQAATPLVHARLHRDAGDRGEFEFPGPDTAVEVGGIPVMAALELDIQLPIPQVSVSDQEVTLDGLVHVENVFAVKRGWLVLHALRDGEIGPALGQISVVAGANEDLAVPIRWREASSELLAVLHEDAEQPGGFAASQDLPVLVAGKPVSAQFAVTLPPDIAVYDQPITDGIITVERASSPGQGWIVVYTAEEEGLGIIIGFAPLRAGVNELVDIEIVETAATPQLFLLLHEDSSDPAEFDFPAADLPASYEDQLIPPYLMVTNPGNYIITADQVLGEKDEVNVPLVVADLAVWLAIFTLDENGALDEPIGELWLPAGINRDNVVEIRSRVTDEPLVAVLHQDGGTPKEFDYPDGDDLPLQRNRQIIQSPFTLTEPDGTSAFSPGS